MTEDAAGRSYSGNRVPGLDHIADLAIQRFVVAVQAEIPSTMVKNHEVTEAAQPIREDHAAGGYSANLLPQFGSNKQAFPG